MSTTKCSFEECHEKAIISCRCLQTKYLLFCAGHLGIHFVSPGKHIPEKLFDDTNIETKDDFLLCMRHEIQNLQDLKENLVREVYDEILKLENSLASFIEKIDEEIVKIKSKIIETAQILGSNKGNRNSEYGDAEFIRKNKNTSILKTPYQNIIFEIHKNIGWVKCLEFKEISNRRNTSLDFGLAKMNTSQQNVFEENTQLQESYKISEINQFNRNKNFESYEMNEDLRRKYNKSFEEHKAYQDFGIKETQFNASTNRAFNMNSKFKENEMCSICKTKIEGPSMNNDCGCISCLNCRLPVTGGRCNICCKSKNFETGKWELN